MKPINGFTATEATRQEKIPAGGYVVKVLDAQVETYSWGQRLVVSYDIAEGPYKDYYRNDYNGNQYPEKRWRGKYRATIPNEQSQYYGGELRTMQNLAWALEQSNPGYKWDFDESKLRGKSLGILVREQEFLTNDGRKVWGTRAYTVTSVAKIHSEDYKIPSPKALNGSQATTAPSTMAQMETVENDDELPF